LKRGGSIGGGDLGGGRKRCWKRRKKKSDLPRKKNGLRCGRYREKKKKVHTKAGEGVTSQRESRDFYHRALSLRKGGGRIAGLRFIWREQGESNYITQGQPRHLASLEKKKSIRRAKKGKEKVLSNPAPVCVERGRRIAQLISCFWRGKEVAEGSKEIQIELDGRDFANGKSKKTGGRGKEDRDHPARQTSFFFPSTLP